MKKITRQLVDKWIKQPFPINRMEMAPFPCKTGKGWPTRIYVSIKHNGQEWTYFGKPSSSAIASIHAHLKKRWTSYLMVEFDRMGLIGMQSRASYRPDDLHGTSGRRFAERVAPTYNPWFYSSSFTGRFTRTKVQKSPTSKFAMYVPVDATTDLTREYLQYAEGQRIKLS